MPRVPVRPLAPSLPHHNRCAEFAERVKINMKAESSVLDASCVRKVGTLIQMVGVCPKTKIKVETKVSRREPLKALVRKNKRGVEVETVLFLVVKKTRKMLTLHAATVPLAVIERMCHEEFPTDNGTAAQIAQTKQHCQRASQAVQRCCNA